METSAVQLERRAAQRFPFHLPVSIRVADSDVEGSGFTQDISARGAFLYTQSSVADGVAIELTLNMPSEITLAESMRVRCRGKVLRVAQSTSGDKLGVAVHLESYEYLPDVGGSDHKETSFGRIAALHSASQDSDESATHRWAEHAAQWRISKAS
jgi:hypothetical protein